MFPLRTIRKADISPYGKYRYSLERDWSGESNASYMLFIGINASTADAVTDDATVRKCFGFAVRNNYKRFFIANLYSYRTKDTKFLLNLMPFARSGPDTDKKLLSLATDAGMIVAAWGGLHDKDEPCRERARFVESELKKIAPIYVIGLTKQGYPNHPSRIGYRPLVLWK